MILNRFRGVMFYLVSLALFDLLLINTVFPLIMASGAKTNY